MTHLRRPLVACLFAASILLPLGTFAPADARGLTGRRAPDLNFTQVVQGLAPGSRVSAWRGDVVLLTFWLRDCPVCRRHIPEVQAHHERYQGFGLRVVGIVHKFGQRGVGGLLRSQRWTLPIATDVDGSMAKAYGVGRRPVDVLIGADGRVLAQGRVDGSRIQRALAAWRVGRLRSWPQGTEGVRALIGRGQYGQALRGGGAAVPGLLEEARRDLQARVARAQRARGAGRTPTHDLQALRSGYQGTPLAAEAAAALAAFTPPSR